MGTLAILEASLLLLNLMARTAPQIAEAVGILQTARDEGRADLTDAEMQRFEAAMNTADSSWAERVREAAERRDVGAAE